MDKFPEIFTNEDFIYEVNHNTKAIACADGLEGWALCMKGNNPPKSFGEGMLKIGIILKKELDDKGATPEGLMLASEKFKIN